jgi:hypothetical protein
VNLTAYVFTKFLNSKEDKDAFQKCKIVEITCYAGSMVTCTALIDGALFFYLPLFAFFLREFGTAQKSILALSKIDKNNYFCPLNCPDEEANFFSIADKFFFFSEEKKIDGVATSLISVDFPDSNVLFHVMIDNCGFIIVRKNTRVLLEDRALPDFTKQREDWINEFKGV